MSDQLNELLYESRAGDFIRFKSDMNDDAVAAIVRGVGRDDADGRDKFRRDLSEEGANALRLFAMRRTLQARRNSSVDLISEAVRAYSLMPRLDDVPWSSWFKGMLFVARSFGVDMNALGSQFAETARNDAIKSCDDAIEAMSRVATLSQCQLTEVTTTYGTGFLELLVFNLTAKAGWLGTKRLAANEIEFQPTTNLVQVVVNLADALEETGHLVVGPIGQDQLAATRFSLAVSGSYFPTSGCLSFIAEGVGGGSSFVVSVAEMMDDADISSLAAAATNVEGQAAIFDSLRIVVISAQPSFEEAADCGSDVDFRDYEERALVALQDPATSAWIPR